MLTYTRLASAFCLPVPDKAQKQFNYVFFVKGSELVTKASPDTIDALVFTISATAPKPGTIFGSDMAIANTVNDEYKTLFDYYITQQLKAAGNGVTIQEGNAKIFHSAIKEAHRPKEPAIHVKAFRGSKDGYIYFLPNGILWAFKKPLMFIPLNQIVAVSYVAVLQRTFNVVVEVEHGNDEDDDEEREEIEFGMIDQEDYENVDGYMKRHGLDDASMADQRKAKRLGVNVVKNEDGEKVDVGDAGELQKAQQEAVLLQQADLDSDEDEGTDGEDFDPGSEGDSEGSGSSDDESDDDDEGGGEQNGDESDDAKYE